MANAESHHSKSRIKLEELTHSFCAASFVTIMKMEADLVGLANILDHDNVTTTQIYTQKPLGVLQDEIEKVHFF